ncbi:GNAT family N-acetyltransferase [Ichthyenterobacterium magnum]|uniref:Acetyltransferase (GNAT) family protein n=1 Tax=Ichthyenterobacterium magnum TaxID=1230530 RepID=A0A420DY02_9FLAO|nr:GNAT family N-acetyltransferase [Ichthyenterobacterium magnum]RKE99061.1 acetyltransferase (GNAT) family protein [Ichthyenterobacterium magnum]
MKVKHLGHTGFNEIMECFLLAFDGYFVKMPTDHDYYKQRWEAAKVNFELSYGMFDDNKLVGFIIHAIDKRENELIAFNTGTGVIPEYRGQRIVKSIYEYAIPDLIKNGITKSVLEVIIENEKAVKAYKGIGFKICKTFKCFSGELPSSKNEVDRIEVSFNEIPWEQMPNQDKYSWDFHFRSLKGGNSKYYNVIRNCTVESFFAINLDNGTINQLEVLNNQVRNWERLFSAIQLISKHVRIINVDDRLEDKLAAIESVGLKNTVNQHEMELTLMDEPVEVK